MAISTIDIAAITGAKLWIDTAQADAAVVVKAASTVLYMLEIDNTMNAAEAEYVRIYNSAGAVVIGTTDVNMIIPVPAATKVVMVFPTGLTLGTGFQVATSKDVVFASHGAPAVAITVKAVYV